MQIQLLHLPGLLNRQLLILPGGIRRQGDAALRCVGRHLVRAMAVFAVHVVRHDDLRPIAPVQPGHIAQHAALLPALFLIHLAHIQPVPVREGPQVGIIAHAAQPQAVQQLQLTVRHGRHQIGHLHGHLPLTRVIGNRAAHEEQLVIRMRGEHQQVRVRARRFPSLHPIGRLPVREDVQLRNRQSRTAFSGQNPDLLCPLRKRRVSGQIVRFAGGRADPFVRTAAHLNVERTAVLIKLNVHAMDGLALRRRHPERAAVWPQPTGKVFPVAHLLQGAPGCAGNGALRRDFPRRFSPCAARRQKQAKHEYGDDPLHMLTRSFV